MTGINRQLTAIERRRRWKTGLRVGGVMLASVGVVLLPRTRHLFEFTKRDSSAFSAVADAGEFAGWALAFIAVGTLVMAVSLLIRGD